MQDHDITVRQKERTNKQTLEKRRQKGKGHQNINNIEMELENTNIKGEKI